MGWASFHAALTEHRDVVIHDQVVVASGSGLGVVTEKGLNTLNQRSHVRARGGLGVGGPIPEHRSQQQTAAVDGKSPDIAGEKVKLSIGGQIELDIGDVEEA